MRQAIVIFLCFITSLIQGQVVFKTIAPQEPIVAGESFRVQYVMEGIDKAENLVPPPFDHFHLVNDPEIRKGTTTNARRIQNTIFTLKAVYPGHYKIPGAIAGIDGKSYRSPDVWVQVISREEAERQQRENGAANENSPYFLAPGEDPYQKIRQNLFVKVLLDKKVCYAGQPVVATFKLYSHLQSKSEISKSPGFYGFTVYDMVNLDDKQMTREQLNGRPFDVHTIRQVQLYPLQAGSFTIDPMEINNKVEFSRSVVNKRTEQEITEGPAGDNETVTPGAELFEMSMSTGPVVITVKPLPARNKPADFNGATGRYTIQASIEKNELAKNEEGQLVITITGKGNFTQLSAPVVQWPAGMEGFDPVMQETLEKSSVPLKGTKTFRYSFTSSKPGNYKIDSIRFSFFDPDSNKYRILSTKPVRVTVLNKEKENAAPGIGPKKASLAEINRKVSLIAAGIVIAGVLVALFYWLTRKKETIIVPEQEEVTVPPPSVDDILQPATTTLNEPGNEFYKQLHRSAWAYLSIAFNLQGTGMNKQALHREWTGRQLPGWDGMNELLTQCEAAMFTGAELEDDREILLAKAKALLEQVKP